MNFSSEEEKKNSSLKNLINQSKNILNSFKNNKNLIFKDDFFTPENKNIFSNNLTYKNRNPKAPQSFFPIEDSFLISQFSCLPKDKNYIWKSLNKDLKIDYNIIKKTKNNYLDDVIPGQIGNCYFTSALKLLSENPIRIEKIFIYNKNNTNKNLLIANLFINGLETPLIIDDYFPYNSQSKNFEFCKINNYSKNIWPMILEKIWAKINSSFEDTISGSIYDSFLFLTPAPIKRFFHDIKHENLFKKISKAIDDNFIVCTDITSTNDNILLRKLGVISNHAYKIVGHGEVRDSKGKLFCLLKIYNPFHTTTWTGKWSPYSKEWTNEFLKHLKYNPDKEKKYFWIEMNDYLKFYTTTYILFYHDQFNYKAKKIKQNGIHNVFTLCKIVINENAFNNNNENKITNGYFIINLKYKRFQINYKHKKDYDNIFINVMLFRIENNNNYKLIDSKCGKEERIFIPSSIKPGEYLISINYPYLNNNNNKIEIGKNFSTNPNRPNCITIGIYSDINMEYVNINEFNYKDKFEKIVIKSIFEKSKKNSHIYYFDKEKENDTFRSINFENEKGAFGYLVIENKSIALLYESLFLCELENVNLLNFIIKDNNNKKINKNNSNNNIIESENNLIDDINTRKFIEILAQKKFIDLYEDSKISISTFPNLKQNLSEENYYEILLKIGSFNKLILIFEKCKEFASIDVRSQIAFKYPLYSIIKEDKTNSTKMRLKYNENEIEIYECIIEHSSGVLFYYKNKTNDMTVNINVTFKEMKNLVFNMTSDDLLLNDKISNSKNKEIKNVKIKVPPNTNKFIQMISINIFKSFNYSFEMNYFIFYSKNKKINVN